MSKHIVAVYGSLRKGMANHNHMTDAQRIALGWLTGYKMYNVGDYPGIIPSHDEGGRVRIEWYKVSEDILTALDQLEGYDPNSPKTSLYIRKPIFSPYGRGWIYLYNKPLEEMPYMEAGDWERFIRETQQRETTQQREKQEVSSVHLPSV